jgi:hypothetical protein
MMFEPMVCSMQTVHLSWVKISTISKPTETSFHLSLITEEYHRVCPKWFRSQWYVWRKPCTNLAPTLHNLQRETSDIPQDPRHLGVPSGVSKMISEPMVHSRQTVHPLALRLALYLQGSKWAFTWASSPSGTNECVINNFWACGTSGANHAPILHRQ